MMSLVTSVVYADAPTVANANKMKFPAPLNDMRPFVLEAINSGEAHGILAGDAAKFIQEKLGATTPLRVNVTRITKYKQPGCARLNAQFLQDDVKFPGEIVGTSREIDFQFNYCLDGRPPQTEGKEYVVNNPFSQGQTDPFMPR